MNTVTASYDHPILGKLSTTFESWATNLVSQGIACKRALMEAFPAAVDIDVNKISSGVL